MPAARALLDAGADPNIGFFESAHQPEPVFESALCGAAGVAHHAELTGCCSPVARRPNLGGEVACHAPEGFDPDAMQAVVASGRLSDARLTTMLWPSLCGASAQKQYGYSSIAARSSPPPKVSLAERALTEMSEWTPHHSRDSLDALRASASEA